MTDAREATLKVRLLKHTQDAERVCAEAARLCYQPIGVEELGAKLSDDEVKKTLKHIMKLGHYSVIEHASFTFAIGGVSRACSHELVRHRIASYSQQSQRHVSEVDFSFIEPATIKANPELDKKFQAFIDESRALYSELCSAGVPKEDARFVLPNACETRLVVTMNARELLHFFELRCCSSAQWEIRALANAMLELVKPIAPTIFENAGPKCVSQKICTEGKRSCGRWKTIPGAILRE
ncbi:MAG: FAD-dependent thymidylate synthase [Candidatus Norongarragalinales archaeon]